MTRENESQPPLNEEAIARSPPKSFKVIVEAAADLTPELEPSR